MSTYLRGDLRIRCLAVAVEIVCAILLCNGCASACKPDANADYGPFPENWKAIALEHFTVLHTGPYMKVEHGGHVLTLDRGPKKGCAMVAGEKVHGWLVGMPLRRYRDLGNGQVEVIVGGYSNVLIRDGKVVWCDCNK
jgi:hypothetical protein